MYLPDYIYVCIRVYVTLFTQQKKNGKNRSASDAFFFLLLILPKINRFSRSFHELGRNRGGRKVCEFIDLQWSNPREPNKMRKTSRVIFPALSRTVTVGKKWIEFRCKAKMIFSKIMQNNKSVHESNRNGLVFILLPKSSEYYKRRSLSLHSCVEK